MPAPSHLQVVRPVAVGIVRVSKVGDRSGERFVSPIEQRRVIEQACDREGLALSEVWDEMDTSGGSPLKKRRGLSRAIDAIECGDAEVLVVAYFDRLFRDLGVQREVLARIELAGGRVLAVDSGEIRTDTASRWLSSTMQGMVAEYHRRITREKTTSAKMDAVLRGVPPFPNIVPGYRRGPEGKLVVEKNEKPHVVRAFQLRDEGASLSQIREYLRQHGIIRSYRATQTLLESRLVLGELRYGPTINPTAHEPIVDRDLWRRVQAVSVPRGRKPKATERLLARLGVLVCGSCGARLTLAMVWNRTAKSGKPRKRYAIYRCGMPGDCEKPVTIAATLVEGRVIAKVRELAEGDVGSASVDTQINAAEVDLAMKRTLLQLAVDTFDGVDAEFTRGKLVELQAAVDQSVEQLKVLRGAAAPARQLSATHNWPDLSIDEQRAIIRLALGSVAVLPAARGERLKFHVRGEETPSGAVEHAANLGMHPVG